METVIFTMIDSFPFWCTAVPSLKGTTCKGYLTQQPFHAAQSSLASGEQAHASPPTLDVVNDIPVYDNCAQVRFQQSSQVLAAWNFSGVLPFVSDQ